MVWQWERGSSVPPTPVVEKIAQCLGVDVADLFEDGDGA
jgi:transcriptional regulator with XRE-family HTH domain